jgi:hypothetical protein
LRADANELAGLAERVAALEARLAELAQSVRTSRLVIVDDDNHERVVAEVLDGVLELRIDLPSSTPGRRTGLLIFSIPEQPELCAGFGLQLWANGNIVNELAWWADQEEDLSSQPDGGRETAELPPRSDSGPGI